MQGVEGSIRALQGPVPVVQRWQPQLCLQDPGQSRHAMQGAWRRASRLSACVRQEILAAWCRQKNGHKCCIPPQVPSQGLPEDRSRPPPAEAGAQHVACRHQHLLAQRDRVRAGAQQMHQRVSNLLLPVSDLQSKGPMP